MRTITVAFLTLATARFATAVTVEEITKPDGTHTVVTRALDIALGPNKMLVSAALFLLGATLCLAAVLLASRRSHAKREAASELSIEVHQRFSGKALLSFPALLLLLGTLLAISGAILAVSERIYTSII